MLQPEVALLGALVGVRAGLTQDQLDVFIDRLVLGRTFEEIARESGCSRANVGLRLRAAREKVERRVAA